MPAIVLCARKDSDAVKIASGLVATEKPCSGCGATLLVSPSSLAIPNADFYCNDCGNATIRSLSTVPTLGIAPGALQQPGDNSRRAELERAGFRELSGEELDQL